MSKVKWSYSSLALFKQCPKKYFHLRVAKDFKEPKTEALLYGTQVHEAAEKFIRDGEPIPAKFVFIQEQLDMLNRIEGNKLCEYKMGLTKNLEPCDFFSQDVWWRGIADLIVVNEEKETAFVVDYKTGKSSRFADTRQLEILTLALFKHFPKVKRVKAGLLFVVAKDFVKTEYSQDSQDQAWVSWLDDTGRLEEAYKSEVWNPKPNFSCKNYCAVVSCIHNGKHH
jgi:hypothetical protein